MEKNYGPDNVEFAWALYSLKDVYWQRDNARAQTLIERALSIFEKDPVANWRGLSWCLNDLAAIRVWNHDYAGAVDYFQRTLEIKERSLGPDHPDVALALNGIGYALMLLGRYDEAQPYIERAVSIAEQTGHQTPLTGEVLESLGQLWWRRGEPAKAKPLLERSVAILEQTRDRNRCGALHTLACALRDLNDPVAEATFRRALAAREQDQGTEHRDVAETLVEYARLLRKMGRTCEAVSMERRAAAITRKADAAGASR